jgi:hypothetical protein
MNYLKLNRKIPARLLSLEHLKWKRVDAVLDSRNICLTNAYECYDYLVTGGDIIAALIAAYQLSCSHQSAKILIAFDFLANAEQDFLDQQQARFECINQKLIQYISEKLHLKLEVYNEKHLLDELIYRVCSRVHLDEQCIELLLGCALKPAGDCVYGKEGYHLFWANYEKERKLKAYIGKHWTSCIRGLPTVSFNKKRFSSYRRNQFIFAKKIILTSPPYDFDIKYFEANGDVLKLSEAAHPVNQCEFSFSLRMLDFIGAIEVASLIGNPDLYKSYLESWDRREAVVNE